MENRKSQHQSKKPAPHPLVMNTSTSTLTDRPATTADIADEPHRFLSASAIFPTTSNQSQQVSFDHPSPPDSPAPVSPAETDEGSSSIGEPVPGRIHEFRTPFGMRKLSTVASRKAASEAGEAREKLKDEIKRSELLRMLYEAYGKVSPSLVLVNKGSVARDHLCRYYTLGYVGMANERTYLAWLRTSLSIVTIGVAITQLFRLESTGPNAISMAYAGRPLGGSFMVLGILFLFFAVLRFFHTQATLADGKFPASRGTVMIGTVSLMGVMIAMFVTVAIITV